MTEHTHNPLAQDSIQHFALDELHLDTENPRFGVLANSGTSEQHVLDLIVEQFGVNDVLSSIAVNGFFESEPLVGVARDGGGIKILEGNRRLAACFILAGDQRASKQRRRMEHFQELQKKHSQQLGRVPVLVYDEQKDRQKLLPYLGVRHIAGAQPWDSFAKATWVARVLDQGDFDLNEISEMVGDSHRTVARIVEGYYFVNQLISAGMFIPEHSTRSGRGSNPHYPFSWIYTSLGYSQIRDWLGLGDKMDPTPNPLSSDRLERGGKLLRFMFGNSSQGVPPVVPDSRDIGELAQSIGEPERLRLLERGRTVLEVSELAKPGHERIVNAMLDGIETLENVYSLLGQFQLQPEEAHRAVEYALRLRRLAYNVAERVNQSALGEEPAEA